MPFMYKYLSFALIGVKAYRSVWPSYCQMAKWPLCDSGRGQHGHARGGCWGVYRLVTCVLVSYFTPIASIGVTANAGMRPSGDGRTDTLCLWGISLFIFILYYFSASIGVTANTGFRSFGQWPIEFALHSDKGCFCYVNSTWWSIHLWTFHGFHSW